MRARTLRPAAISILVMALLVASGSVPMLVPFAPRDASAQEPAGTTATTTDDVNLRSGPALSAAVLLVVPMGETVTLRGQDANGFTAVTYGGRDGWLFKTYLSIDEPAPPPTRTATTTDDLNLRAGPGTGNGILTVIPRGSVVTITGADTAGFLPVTWEAFTGWVATAYLDTGSGPPTPAPQQRRTTTDDLNLRAGPGTSSGIRAVIPAGSTVTLNGSASAGFVPVTWNGASGWVSQDYLASTGTNPAPAPPPQQTNGAATDAVNFRSGPGTSYAVLATIPKGARLVLTGKSQGGFLSAAYEGRQGWVSGDWVTVAGTEVVPVAYAITTDALNLRSGPDASRAVLTTVAYGEVVQLTGQQSNGFRSVQYGDTTGWMFASFLDVLPGTATGSAPAFAVSNTIVGPARGSVATTLAFARRAGAQRMDEVERYVREIYRLAPAVGFDPGFLVAQSAHETGNWTSSWWTARLNPAGIGVTGDPFQNSTSPRFANGTMAARAQIAHMHAEVFGASRPLPAVLQGADPTYQAPFLAGWAGDIRTISDLAGTWAADPQYDVKLVRKAREMFTGT
ncbi:MAG: SH3 domain-containing protein [Thermomicrobiales bacterium]